MWRRAGLPVLRRVIAAEVARSRGVEVAPEQVVVTPGAFHAWVDVRGTGMPAGELADRLLSQAGVAVAPGTCLGPGGEGHLRLGAAVPRVVADEAVARIGRCLPLPGPGGSSVPGPRGYGVEARVWQDSGVGCVHLRGTVA